MQATLKNPFTWLSIGLLLVVFVALFRPQGHSVASVLAHPTPSVTTTRRVFPTATQEVGKVGSSWYHDGYRATLVAVQPLAVSHSAVPQDYEYLQVSVWLFNQSRSQVGYNEQLFSVQDGRGDLLETTDSPPSYTDGRWLGTGELQPGDQVRGDLFFIVPAGDHQATLRWQPEVLRDTILAWNLGL